MSDVSILIGTDQLDFNAEINVKRQVNDIRDIDIGGLTTSYTFDLPVTNNNKRLLQNYQDVRSRLEVTTTAYIYVQNIEIIRGKLRILYHDESKFRVIIEGDDWLDPVKGLSIQDLDWTGKTHSLTQANVENSWNAAAGALYRYPLINFCRLWSEDSGYGGLMYPYDFYPCWNVNEIIKAIIAETGYVLATSGFFDGTDGLKKYLLSQPSTWGQDFIENKGLSVYVDDTADNYDSDTVGSGGNASVSIDQIVIFGAETLDEGADFNVGTGRYTVPETGTYRFKAQIRVTTNAVSTSPDWQNDAQYISWSINLNGTPVVSFTDSETYPPECTMFDYANALFTLDTGWIHCDASDYIEVDALITMAATDQAGGGTLEIYITAGAATSFLETTWDQRNLWPGLNYTADPAVMLPDLECIAFLKALRQTYNLRFFVDRMKRTVYIETSDDFYSSTVVDWSDKVDYSAGYKLESIASNYKKTQRLQYSPDTEDKAYTDFVAAYGAPYRKDITLDSEYAQPGLEERQVDLFSPTATGMMIQTGILAELIPRIWGNAPFDTANNYPYPEFRPLSWRPRLFTYNWESMGGALYIDTRYGPEDTGFTRTYFFCRMLTDDFADIYDAYLLNDWRRIGKNKILTCRLNLNGTDLIPFTTVISTVNAGFRAIYKINIEGVEMYWMCSKLITDGQQVQAEFIQKL